ncbi:MAG: DUF3489 domain-containing protein, partial [Acidobacteria bacterium]|nr:DUF3489 domain-containing protein [Acidobacteriota bacterium]
MPTFTIDNENDITVFASYKEAKTSGQEDAVIFTSQDELAKLAAHWPTHRLVEIWNSLTGVPPVKKFRDRKTAITRIWKALQSLRPAPEAEACPERSRGEKAALAHDVATGRAAQPKATSKAKGRRKTAPEGQGARAGSKKAAILELLRRPGGATLTDLTAATGWQAHSVRGFISGAIV